MSPEPNKVIYSMVGVSKFYDKKRRPQRHLSFLFLWREDRRDRSQRLGQIVAAAHPGRRRQGDQRRDGYLARATPSVIWSRNRLIDDSRTVREVVEEAVQETVNLLKEFEEINAKFAEEMSDEDMDKLLERQGEVQEKLDHQDAWDLDARLEMAMDALRCPPPDTRGEDFVRRRTAPRGVVPVAAAKARHSSARRADQPSRCRVGRVARASSAELSGHDHRRHA